jgi:Uma2 family endonuclease
LTTAEYLTLERSAQYKSDYHRGRVAARASCNRAHNLITGNVQAAASEQLKRGRCEVYASDMRLKVAEAALYTYPDVTIVCDEPLFEDEVRDTLLNPTVLFEVLSKSTELCDRGMKSASYRKIPSLKEYVLIAQNCPQVERYVRQSDGSWLLREASELTESVTLEPVGVVLPLAEIYRQVTFDEVDDAAQ